MNVKTDTLPTLGQQLLQEGRDLLAAGNRTAAAQVLVGLASTSQSRMAVTSGGTSTRSATTANTR